MKALTLWQPWALAVALGVKPVENRSWTTSHRGELAVHAGQRWDWSAVPFVVDALRRAGHLVPGTGLDVLQSWHPAAGSGVIVATVNLTGICDAARDASPARMPLDCDDWAEPGQFHWQLRDSRALPVPVPARGRQQVWDMPDTVAVQVCAQSGTARLSPSGITF